MAATLVLLACPGDAQADAVMLTDGGDDNNAAGAGDTGEHGDTAKVMTMLNMMYGGCEKIEKRR